MKALSSRVRVAALVAAVLAGAGSSVLLASRPRGAADPAAAVRLHLREAAKDGTVRVLTATAWGAGRLVLSRFSDEREQLTLSLAFAIDQGRGWRVAASTRTVVTTSDVQVASLVVSSAPGGKGQPSWSAAYGEVSREGIAHVEVQWVDGTPTRAPVAEGAYLAVGAGRRKASLVRYLSGTGDEVAKVPVGVGSS